MEEYNFKNDAVFWFKESVNKYVFVGVLKGRSQNQFIKEHKECLARLDKLKKHHEKGRA